MCFNVIIVMTDHLPNTEFKQQITCKQQICEFNICCSFKLTTFMQARLYGIRFVENKGDRSIRCFNWKTSLKQTVFSALASDTGLINKG